MTSEDLPENTKKIHSLYQYCYSGNLEEIKILVNQNADSKNFIAMINDIETLFYIINGFARTKVKEDIMVFLKDNCALDLNKNNGYALEMAVQTNDIDLVKFLIINDVKMINYEDRILLYYAAEKGNYDMFFMLKRVFNINLDSELVKDIRELNLTGELKYVFDNMIDI